VFLAAALLFGDLPELLAPLPLEGADAAPGDDQGFARVRSHSSQMDFPEVHCRLNGAGSRFPLGNFDTDMQLEAPVPDGRAGSGVFRQGDGQDERRVAPAHRQNDTSLLPVDGLGGPLDRVEFYDASGILHAHLGMLPVQHAGRQDVGEEGMDDLLHRLSAQGKPPFGSLLQLMLSRPRPISQTYLGCRVCMQRFHTRADSRCASLRRRKSKGDRSVRR
jgi:hypothetical protein